MFHLPITDPTLIFFVVLTIILFAPIIMGKLRIPHIIGLVLAGVLIGEYGFNILQRDNSFELFGKVGIYYIMFLAALEMDMSGMIRNWQRVALFGILSFAIPFVLTVSVSTLLPIRGMASCVLLGCIMSSNTLIAYPIVSRYGLQKKPSVSLSVGATMISLLISLIVLASLEDVCRSGGNPSAVFWIIFVVKFCAFTIGSVIVLPRLARYFLRRYSDAVMQFIFVLSQLFLCAALSELIGLEGIFGAFLAGLILNRYIPHVSPLMNRLEFTGNAIFIPYFLIGVGMLVNLRPLINPMPGEGYSLSTFVTIFTIVFVGTFGKWAAAIITARLCRLPHTSGRMMFGLTSAHAAGAIAMIMVGLRVTGTDGLPLANETMLNGVVLMILVTCIISTLVTESTAKKIVLRDQDIPEESIPGDDDEKILVPVKYPEYANRLISLATMMRNEKLKRPLAVLSVVYDDDQLDKETEKGKRLLEQVTNFAAASDVAVESQVRVAANIANGIKHAFKEFRASEIIIGMHTHMDASTRMWGQFHQSLFNGMNRQIIITKLSNPLSTLRSITVAVPSRAQFEAGFYRWLERLCRLAANLGCTITFHARKDTMLLIERFVQNRHSSVKAKYEDMEHWNEIPELAHSVREDHLLVVVTARKGTVSYKNAQDRLLEELAANHNGRNLMILFPDQHGDAMDEMTFAQPQHTEEKSYYKIIHDFFGKFKKNM